MFYEGKWKKLFLPIKIKEDEVNSFILRYSCLFHFYWLLLNFAFLHFIFVCVSVISLVPEQDALQ